MISTATPLIFLLIAINAYSLKSPLSPSPKDYSKSFLPIIHFTSQKFGYVTIQKSPLNSGYYVNVDFHPIDAIHDQDLEDNKMMLALYMSDTLLTKQCQNFSSYDCDKYGCDEDTVHNTKGEYPYFQASGHYAKLNIYLDYVSWNLESKAILGNTCSNGTDNTYGSGTYGLIGMGIGGSSWANYRGQRLLLSVYIDQTGNNGQLSFSFDSSKALSSEPVTRLDSDVNWHMRNVSRVQVGDSQVEVDKSVNMIFDINYDAVGFPVTIYQDILRKLSQEGNLDCRDNNGSMSVCTNLNRFGLDLPDITITVGNSVLTLPPDIYVQDFNASANPGTITLNLRALDIASLDPSVYVTYRFHDFIILGSSVMKYYYTIFNATSWQQGSLTIELYQAGPTPPIVAGSHSSPLYIIIGSAVAFVIVSLVVFYLYRKYWKKSRALRTISSVTTDDRTRNNNTVSEPLIAHSTTEDLTFSTSINESEASIIVPRVERNDEAVRLLPARVLRSDVNQDNTMGDLVLAIGRQQ